MKRLSKYKFQIISLMLFTFIFYSGCTTTNTGKLESEDIHIATIDSFYYAVTRTKDTINLANTSAKLKKGEDSIDDVITYKISDTTTAKKFVKILKTSDLKSLYAKYTKMDYIGTVLLIAGVAAAVTLLVAYLISHALTSGSFSVVH